MNQSLYMLYPSRLPERMMAVFPPVIPEPGRVVKRISASDAEIKELEIDHFTTCHLFNPPLSLIKQLPKHPAVTLSFDSIPTQEMFPWIKPYPVHVPSLALRSIFRQHGISAEVVHPCPVKLNSLSDSRRQSRKRFHLYRKQLLWIDDRLINARHRPFILHTLQNIVKQYPELKVGWVTKRLTGSINGFTLIHPERAERERLWAAADYLLTAGPVQQSLTPLHLQFLSMGIPVITAEGGDHDEWVNHLFSGVVLNRKYLQKELRKYLNLLLRQPRLVSQLRNNGRILVNSLLELKQ
ncbi:hypothetical protein ACFO25_18675 [Paenactinomyces guangxiensis]|uniref:Glycosyltransferase n=1 Tax=Paenactinomyces guangxiensis TaxID=1490290 RepID=A0A7W1WRC2_9BACL|nr:hypothetical protein [Paenactinomyces guangxiensis]MBA4494471.1 hypothetical protein [Paenactinomyces guangxiensis]MBH8591474.1 hypothetical protein [Paenactinomyces guangxiensis]